MGVEKLLEYLDSGKIEGSCVNVNLTQLGHTVSQQLAKKMVVRKISQILPSISKGQFSLLVDAECCLDRLYGGYYSDWVCGGQWNRMVSFLSNFVNSLRQSNVHVVVFFNGSFENERFNEWVLKQEETRNRANAILRHIAAKGTPPPKVWWIPPICLRTAVKLYFHHLKIPVICSVDDHHLEFIKYCRQYKFHGLMADDAEYLAFDPPRFFSAHSLKLTRQQTLEAKEYIVSRLIEDLKLNKDKLCALLSLLGNFVLPQHELFDYYKRCGINQIVSKVIGEEIVKKIVDSLQDLPPIKNNFVEVATHILGHKDDKRVPKLAKSMQYYLNAIIENSAKSKIVTLEKIKNFKNKTNEEPINITESKKLGSESLNTQMENLVILEDSMSASNSYCLINQPVLSDKFSNNKVEINVPNVATDVLKTAYDRHTTGLMSTYVYHILTKAEIKLPVILEDDLNHEIPSAHIFYRQARQMVYGILFNLHHAHYLAKNTSTVQKADTPVIQVREWIRDKANIYKHYNLVNAEPLGWGVPTVHRLWFGTTPEDNIRRLRAFLTCMRSDTPLMYNTDYVPQHTLIIASVLRYIMSNSEVPILQKYELDAFIITAVAPELSKNENTQELQGTVSVRGVQLATLLMSGVETAMLVNDACGAPVPWLMSCPWMYFDGRLFQYHLARAQTASKLEDLCENQFSLVIKVEKMRQAILHGLGERFQLVPQYQGSFIDTILSKRGTVPIPPQMIGSNIAQGIPSYSHPSRQNRLINQNSSRFQEVQNTRQRAIVKQSSGGQLEVAGAVVGIWGANYNMTATGNPYMGRNTILPSQHMMPPIGGPSSLYQRDLSSRLVYSTRHYSKTIKGRSTNVKTQNSKKKLVHNLVKKDNYLKKSSLKNRSIDTKNPTSSEKILTSESLKESKMSILNKEETDDSKASGVPILNGNYSFEEQIDNAAKIGKGISKTASQDSDNLSCNQNHL
ncbi:constitutive coactivator of PPAR-gamma-like protein 1 homolog isoform X2 [Daktulosphaira vitifoliae]|uniref:constitutive coactivator of PPAR-gamma-like protein 1 homolog isoform X2 n=1 Tax=Daktulosphaira vitifoliae TaxID=58002 RepID=UPI0021AABA7F|nr:constitutive coactivator of PPAR-gamma-like protein 1 homolog isoform X2 [Daktulosphaira vitifoliae]